MIALEALEMSHVGVDRGARQEASSFSIHCHTTLSSPRMRHLQSLLHHHLVSYTLADLAPSGNSLTVTSSSLGLEKTTVSAWRSYITCVSDRFLMSYHWSDFISSMQVALKLSSGIIQIMSNVVSNKFVFSYQTVPCHGHL